MRMPSIGADAKKLGVTVHGSIGVGWVVVGVVLLEEACHWRRALRI